MAPFGIYAYRRAALDRSSRCRPGPLELRESLEQLRALEDGMRIACARMEPRPFGVDTPETWSARVASSARRECADDRYDRFPGRVGRLFRSCLPRRLSGMTTLPCELFETAMDAVGRPRELAMLPCENSLAGRVSGHPPSAAGFWPVRDRRAVPARRALPSGRQAPLADLSAPIPTLSRWARCGASCARWG